VPSTSSRDSGEVIRSVEAIIRTTRLCTIATNSGDGIPAAATVFYVLDFASWTALILTRPNTVHAHNFSATNRSALAIYSTDQSWREGKVGLQLSATPRLTPQRELQSAFDLYVAAFPALGQRVSEASQIEEQLEARFYSLKIDAGKLFDEPTFGSSVWISFNVVESEL